MSETPEKVLLGIIELKEAKRIKSALEDRGVRLELLNNPETCASGNCAPSVELYAMAKDLTAVQEFFQAEKTKAFEGLEFDPSLANEIFDSEKDTARCPACGETFSTQLLECPGCGLGFGPGPG